MAGALEPKLTWMFTPCILSVMLFAAFRTASSFETLPFQAMASLSGK